MGDKGFDSGKERKNSKDEKERKNGKEGLSSSTKDKKKEKDKDKKKDERKNEKKTPSTARSTPSTPAPSSAGSTKKPSVRPTKEKGGSDITPSSSTSSTPQSAARVKETETKRDSWSVSPSNSPSPSDRRVSLPVTSYGDGREFRRPSLPSSQRFTNPQYNTAKGETPSDFIFQVLMGEFKEQSKRKMEEMMAWGLEKRLLLSEVFDPSEDPVYNQLLETMGRLGESCVPVMIRALLNWRSNQHVVDGTLKNLLQKEQNSKMSQKDGLALLEERHHLATDFIFCTALLSLIKSRNENLDEAICSQLEAISFEHFKPMEKQNKAFDPDFAEALVENRKEIPKLYAQILGILSPYRLTHIAAALFKELGVASKNNQIIKNKIAILEGMRYLQLKVNTQQNVEQSMGFLSRYFDLFKHKSSDFKFTLSSTIVSITQPLLLEKPVGGVDYADWHKASVARYGQFDKKLKTRTPKTWIPLLCSILCLCDRDFFLQHFSTFIDASIRLLKDKTNRSVGLEAIHNSLATYLGKFAEPSESQNKRLMTITSAVFPSGSNWKSQHDREHLSIYVNITTVVAEKKLDYAMKTIIFDLLRVDNNPQADRVLIGIRALMKIVDDERKKGNPSDTGIPAAIAPYMPSINESFSAILLLWDKNFGQLTELHLTKQAQELLQKERQSVKLLRALVSCVPFCMPTKIPTGRFMEILSRYLIHLDDIVKTKAHEALTRIMNACPSLRSDVIHAVAQLTIVIPDSYPTLLFQVLQKYLSPLLHSWSGAIKPPDLSEPSRLSVQIPSIILPPIKTELKSEQAFNPSSVEAVGLVFLCSPFAIIRIWAVEILRSVRLIATSMGYKSDNDDDDLPPAHVMDIVDETGPDIVQRLHQDFRFRIKNKTSRNLPLAKTMEKLWSSEENQVAWTYCLGALLPLTLSLCPEATNAAWKIVCKRMKTPKTEDKPGSPISREQELIWWSNYIVFACATVSDTVVEAGNKKIPSSPADMFNHVLGFLKSEVHADAVVMALERTNPQVYDVLFSSMQHIEQEYTMKKKRKGSDELRNQISFIYSFVSENMKQGTLVDNENLRQIFLGWISETTKYLSHPSTECILDNHLALRYNYCAIVGNVARDLHRGSSDLFEIQHRKELFHFLKNWCRGEAMLNDEVNKKTYQSNLAQIRDTEKKSSYEKAVKDQTFVLQQVACSAASALLLGPCFDEEVLSPKGSVFTWVNSLLEQEDRKKLYRHARTALEAFLQNTQHRELLDTAINQCYSTNPSVARGYFLALVELFRTQTVDSQSLPVLFNLILLKAGDSSLAIRRSAIQLLQLLSSQMGEENISYSPLAINSSLDVTYRRSQYELSQRLAKQNPRLVPGMAAEMVHRLEFEPGELLRQAQPHLQQQQQLQKQKQQKQMLTTIIPWIQEMNAHIHVDENYLSTTEIEEILQNFLLVTLRYSDVHPIHVQKIWTTLAAEDESIELVIEYLLNIGVKKRNPSFIPLAKKVITFFGRATSQVTVDTLVNELSSMDTDSKKKDRKAPGSGSLSGVPTPFDSELPDNPNDRTPARGHLALIFLAELAFELKDEFLNHLPVVLHQVFLGFDTSVSEHCRVLLLNLVHSLVVERLESTEETPEGFPEYTEALELEEYLKVFEKKQLWNNEDISIERLRKIDLQSAKDLISLTQRVVRVFVQEESLKEDWGTEALKWAISCPSAHLVARSYQVYRGLLPCSVRNITPIDMLESLKHRCSSRSAENISISFEILFTLQAMVDTLDAAKLWIFPQIFWAAVALLHTDFEQEYLQAIRVLAKLVTRFNFSDIAVQNVFLTGIPTTWQPPFVGLQPLVMRGLLSPITEAACIELMVRFTLMPCPQIFYPEPKRVLSNILSLLPWLSSHITEESPSHPCFNAFGNLAEACSSSQTIKLQKIFSNCKKKLYPSMEAFFQDLYKPFAATFFPKYTVYTLKFLFSVLESEQKQYHKMVLRLLRYLIPEVNLSTLKKRDRYITRWLSLVSRFVTSADPLWRDGLEVLEQVVKQSELSVTHIYSTSLRPVPYTSAPKVFPGLVSVSEDGDRRALGALNELLKSTEQREKSNGISQEFFEHFFYTEEEAVEEETAIDKNRSPKQTYVRENEDSGSDDDDDVDFSEFQDILSFAPAGGGVSPVRPSAGDYIESGLDKSQDLLMSRSSDSSGTVRMSPSDDSNDVLSPSAWTRRRWRKLSERRRFSNEAEMFEIFPVAGQLLNLLLDEYRTSLVAYGDLVPSDDRKALQSPVLKADIFDQPLFQQQIPEPKQNSVLFSIVCSKYRSLADQDSLFLRTFTDKRIQLVDAFNHQLRIYLEHKDNVEVLKTKIPKDFDDHNQQHRLSVLLFVEAVFRLHYHLLLLYQINASLQALVNGVLDSSAGQPLADTDSDEEKQRSLIEKELERNRSLMDVVERKIESCGGS